MPGAPASASRFEPAWLGERLATLQAQVADAPRGLLVAWSGGADSTALLAALCELRDAGARLPPLRALHVDHGLQPDSRAWARHCRALAARLGVRLTVRRVRVAPAAGDSLEALAREARLAAFAAALRPGEWVLTAQHARDQLETLLLQLLRGAGPAGLAAMPASRALGRGLLVRPLLDREPGALRAFLAARELPWIEDPSNADSRFDRNYLRARVLPAIEARWPAAARSAGRSAALIADLQRSERRRAARLLALARDGEGLALTVLRRWPAEERHAVLREWIASTGCPLPDRRRLLAIAALAGLREDAQPVVQWGGVEARRHDDRLLLRRRATGARARGGATWRWRARASIAVGEGRLSLRRDARGDVDLARLPAELRVGSRGEGVRDPAGRAVDVKGLLQQSRVPAWERASLPFLYAPGEGEQALIAIADLWIAPAVRADARTRDRGRFVWQRAD